MQIVKIEHSKKTILLLLENHFLLVCTLLALTSCGLWGVNTDLLDSVVAEDLEAIKN